MVRFGQSGIGDGIESGGNANGEGRGGGGGGGGGLREPLRVVRPGVSKGPGGPEQHDGRRHPSQAGG